jgi:TolB-like protein/Tfp pilus assembly protein PilF
MKRFLGELQRRNVFRAAVLYVGAVWALAQGIAQLGPTVGMPDWGTRWFLVAAIIGFPFWIAFAWFFELTPEGLKRERDLAPDAPQTRVASRTLDFAIIGVLAIAVVLLLTDRFVAHRDGSTASTPVSGTSIAVLPFVDMSQAKDQEYFSDGIAEDLLNLLTRTPGLQVVARTSSFSFKGKDIAIPDIAKALRVANILEGSVRKAGDEVRISAQLVRAADGVQIWSQSWDHKLDDVFKIQDEIAVAVVKKLRVTLLGETPTAKPIDPAVYPLVLQAEALMTQTPESRAQAFDLLQRVVATAPDTARAWADLARLAFNQGVVGERPSADVIRIVDDATSKALAIDPDNVLALSMRSRLASDYSFDLPTAARYAQRALDIEPGNLVALGSAASLLEALNRSDEAVGIAAYRVAHDPANLGANLNLGVAQIVASQWDAAIATYRDALQRDPSLFGAHSGIGAALLFGKRDGEGALAEYQAEPDASQRAMGVAAALHRLGRQEESEAALNAAIKTSADVPTLIAGSLAYQGHPDQAFEWLEKAATARDPFLMLIANDASFVSLHDDPRWLPFLTRIGFAPAQLAAVKLDVKLPPSMPSAPENATTATP